MGKDYEMTLNAGGCFIEAARVMRRGVASTTEVVARTKDDEEGQMMTDQFL